MKTVEKLLDDITSYFNTSVGVQGDNYKYEDFIRKQGYNEVISYIIKWIEKNNVKG